MKGRRGEEVCVRGEGGRWLCVCEGKERRWCVCEGRKEGVGVCVREERRWCEGMMTCTFSLSALFSASLPCHSAV